MGEAEEKEDNSILTKIHPHPFFSPISILVIAIQEWGAFLMFDQIPISILATLPFYTFYSIINIRFEIQIILEE
jgi:hypothetical protein